MKIKYLLDENVNPRLRKALAQHAVDMIVWQVGDPGAPPFQTTDPDILDWCEQNGFILVTNNRATMPVHLRDHLQIGNHVPGIFTLHPDMTIGETVDDLLLIWSVTEQEAYIDQIIYLPIGP